MLCIVCTGKSNSNLNKWLDYYFHIGIRYIFYMGLVPGDNAYSYFKQKYINEEDCNPDEFI